MSSKWRRNIDAPHQPSRLTEMSMEQRRDFIVAMVNRRSRANLIDMVQELTLFGGTKGDTSAAVNIYLCEVIAKYAHSLQNIQDGKLTSFDVAMLRELESMVKTTIDTYVEAYGG